MSKTVELLDGRKVDVRSEEWRHECEARAILSLPTKHARRHQLNLIGEARGAEAVKRLERSMLLIWKSNQGSR